MKNLTLQAAEILEMIKNQAPGAIDEYIQSEMLKYIASSGVGLLCLIVLGGIAIWLGHRIYLDGKDGSNVNIYDSKELHYAGSIVLGLISFLLLVGTICDASQAIRIKLYPKAHVVKLLLEDK